MKFKTKNTGYELLGEEALLTELLKDRGVIDVKAFLNVSEKDVLDGMLLKNMKEGITCLKKHLDNDSRILVIIDSDTDGYTSGAFIYQYIQQIKKDIKIDFLLHGGKEHGIVLGEFENHDFDLLIVPDAGSSDVEQCEVLKNLGKDILILDHHIIAPRYSDKELESIKKQETNIKNDYASDYAIVINCQDGQYPNNTLSGVGVVYKFCKEFDKAYGYNLSDNYLDLVAIGMVADDMSLQTSETRYLVLQGLGQAITEKGNKLFQEIYKKNERAFDGAPTIINVGWNIAPLINAMVRSGEMEEKTNTFKALIGVEETVEYQPRRKNKNDPKPPLEYHTLQETMARICTNVKGRQDKRVKKGMDALITKIEEQGLDNDKIIVVEGTSELDSTFTGLVANKISGKYKRPCIILKEYNIPQKDEDGNILSYKQIYGGSGRNYSLFELDDLRDYLLSTNCFISVDGHENAFGFKLEPSSIERFKKVSNEDLKEIEIDDTYHVDYAIKVGNLREKDIIQVGKWERVWGNDVPAPLFAITGISITADNVILNEKKNYLKIVKEIGSRKFTFYKFSNEEEYNNIIGKKSGFNSKSKRLELEIIGKFEISKFNGAPQISIVDYNVKEARKFEF